MSPRPLRLLASTTLLGLALFASRTARAEDAAPPSAPADPPGYAKSTTQTEYVAPLSQKTQPSYVPQSVALSGPREIKDWEEGAPVPPGYRPVERARKGLIIGGAVTFGSLYLLTALVAAASDDAAKASGTSSDAKALWIPAFGPFVQMAHTTSETGKLFLAIDGIGQTAGLTMLVVGIASHRTVLVRNDLAEVRVVPLVARDASGAAVVGSF